MACMQGDIALWSSGDRQHKDTLTPYFPALPANAAILPAKAHSLEEFTLELKVALDKQQLPKRALDFIFQNEHVLSQPHPNCGGVHTVVADLCRLLARLMPPCADTEQHSHDNSRSNSIVARECAVAQGPGWSLVCSQEAPSTWQLISGKGIAQKSHRLCLVSIPFRGYQKRGALTVKRSG